MKRNIRCLNCNNLVTDNYCGKCGQSIHTNRFNEKHLIEELQLSFLHVNAGLLFTIKELLIRPGKTIKGYLAGKRIKYTRPFSFLIILGTIYSIISHLFHYSPVEEMNKGEDAILEYIPLFKWYTNYFSIAQLLIIPFYALGTRLFFRQSNYNYIEHLVVFSYLSGIRVFILLIFYPLIYLGPSVDMYRLGNIVSDVYIIWAVYLVFRTSSQQRLKTILSILGATIVAVFSFMIILVFLFELLKYFNIHL